MFFIPCQLPNTVRGGMKECAEHICWMAAANSVHFRWHGHCDHEVIDRQQILLLLRQKLCHLVLSALWTIPVSAGRIGEMSLSAIRTRIDRPMLHLRRPACANVVNRMPLNFRQRIRISVNMFTENIGDVRHGQAFFTNRPSIFPAWLRPLASSSSSD